MMPRDNASKHCTVAALLSLVLFTTNALASPQSGQWVRVHHGAERSALASADVGDRLADYGSFQWGRLDHEQIERLRARGLSVSIEDNPFALELGGERFDPLETRMPASSRTPDPDGDFYIVQFEGPIRSEWLRRLRETGVEVTQPLHPFSYVVWASSSPVQAAASLPEVRWSGLMRANWKVSPFQRYSEPGVHSTMALASAHVGEARLADSLRAFGRVRAITPLNRHYRIVHLEVERRDYPLIAELPAIFTVQYIPPETGPRGEMSNQSIVGAIDGSGAVQPGYATWLNDTGYDGSGITVGVVDGRVRTSHQDLVDRIQPCNGSNGSCGGSGTSDHGTHVAGAIAGTGATGTLNNGFLRGQGVAPGAGIVTQRYSPFTDSGGPGAMVPDGMLKIYQDSAKSETLLTNNSWGPTGSPQGYDIPTQQIDFISRDADPDVSGDQPVLAVWSVMNGNGDGSGACAPSSLGSPDEAKNLFAVGSTALQSGGGSQVSNIFSISSNSGHGPACDGRRVPHIVAPGCSTDSTSNASDTAHTFKCGTSMASPVVSGAVALWAEKYIAETGSDPSPALVKAVFTAAAQDLEGETNADGGVMGHRPDRFQGYGRIDFETVMNHGVEVFLHDQETVFANTGEDWSASLIAVDPAEPIRIMLAWTDAPGPALGGTTEAWVNDLDLSVGADGSTYYGNVIGPDGWSAAGGSADDRNNLEGVFLSPAQHGGAVDITVTAADLAGDALDPYDPDDPSQDFALACYNCIVGDPTYTIEPAPESLGACIPESGSDDFDVDVILDTLGAYSGTVGLTASGEPGGVTSSFSPASVAVPGTSVWTLSVSDTASPSTTTLSVEGDDGSDQHAAELALTLDANLDSAPAQVAPSDGAADLVLAPTFEWNALPDVAEYRIQVSTDSGFGSTVIDETVTATNFTPPSPLALDTEYFWRVQGVNLCGGGDWSPTRSFTTRLEPEADLSQAVFDFELNAGQTGDATLTIGNTGTGNLTWEIATDALPPSLRGSYDPARDEVLSIDDFSLPGDGSHAASATGGLASDGPVVGFSFEGTVSGISGTTTYASDMAMTVTSPDADAHTVGGFQTGNPEWDFQGSSSDDDGTYSSTHVGDAIFGAEGTADEGSWQFDFEHTYNDTMDWSDVTITLHKVAPPYCEEPLSTPAWLGATPVSGSVGAGLSEDVTIDVDATGMAEGSYVGYLCVTTNDPANSLVVVEVRLDVKIGIFRDRFEGSAP
ncbi:MAG: S8 family serine peptidase [Gammaproteobacteria bacterium]|jgi:hypothetical protein|nr:S8 family serine peptidase [Gammaproteobacteria bacterium]